MREGLACPGRAVPRASLWLSLVISCAASVTSPARAGAGEDTAIAWRPTFEQARSESRSRNRPVWVQFTGSWCVYCRKMDRETLAGADVVAWARDALVPVKVHAESREDLMAQFGISGLPATVLLDPSGRVIARHEGYAEGRQLLGLFNSADSAAVEAAPVALAGYCPVTLVEGRGLRAGRPELTLRQGGREYRFADARERTAFVNDPERFLPSNDGRCVVSWLDRRDPKPGSPHFGVYYRGRLYLCADEQARRRFARDPERYARADVADHGYCPHCKNTAGREVPGLPEYAATHGGRRYLFPDRTHLEAFRSSPERYVR